MYWLNALGVLKLYILKKYENAVIPVPYMFASFSEGNNVSGVSCLVWFPKKTSNEASRHIYQMEALLCVIR